jgi:hypothetical protein
MVTHLTTNPPVRCLNDAEQTGCVVLIVLWSNVRDFCGGEIMNLLLTLKIKRPRATVGHITTIIIESEWISDIIVKLHSRIKRLQEQKSFLRH